MDPDPDLDSIGIQLLEAPANRRADPRALRYIVDHLPPGSVIRRQLKVVNRSAERKRIELYPAAATIDKAGFQFGAGRATNELTSWTALDRTEVELEPDGEATFKATIEVPVAASAGERYAVIWASLTPASPDPSANVRQIHRVGVRVYLDIGPGGEPASDFDIGELVPARDKSGVPSVAIKVTNTGGRALDMTGSAALTDGPAGTRAGPFNTVRGTTIAPGESGLVTVLFPRDLPNGPWQITVHLESGLVKKTATGKVTFPNPGEVGKATTLFAPLSTPWGLLGISLTAGLVIVGGLGLFIRRSRRRTVPVAPEDH